MTDRVYPSAKQTSAPPAVGNPGFPATKAQLYSNARPAYRPQARHSRRSRCCSCCLWTTVAILVLILLAGLAAVAFYLIYRPQRPSFSVTSLKLSLLNLTSSSQLSSSFDISVAARNPNKKLAYLYGPTAVAVSSADAALGEATLPAFAHPKRNTTTLRARIAATRRPLDAAAASALRASMRGSAGVPIALRLDTKVRAKVGGLKTPRIGIRVVCDGIRVTPPRGKTAATATTSKAKCKVDVRVKIWKWTF